MMGYGSHKILSRSLKNLLPADGGGSTLDIRTRGDHWASRIQLIPQQILLAPCLDAHEKLEFFHSLHHINFWTHT
jgi:ABC-type multidrug transport system ATPase subunit